MTRSKHLSDSGGSSSSEDGKKSQKKKKSKRSYSESSDESQEDSEDDSQDDSEDESRKKKDYKRIVLEVTNEETEYRHKLYPDFHQVLQEDIKCTVCFKDLEKDVSSGKSINSHPKLEVLQCKRCSEVHNDSDCDGLACMWCKSNDDLFSCVSCTSQLCEGCIKKNLGKKVLKAAEEDDWKCILCNPRILWKCRAKCWAAMEEAKFIRLKKNKNALSALVEKRKTRTRKPPARRTNKKDESDKSDSSNDSEASTEEVSNKGEDSDVEDMYSSNREENSKQCVKRRKMRKNRRSSRSFSENKGDETDDSDSDADADAKQNGGTPRLAAKRGKNLSFAPKTNGKLASSSSDSTCDEDEAHKRRAKGGIEALLEDFQSVGDMLVDQSVTIKKKLKLAVTAGDPNAKALAIKKLLNVVTVGCDTLKQIKLELTNLTKEGHTGSDPTNESVKDAVNDVSEAVKGNVDTVVSATEVDKLCAAKDDVASAAKDDVASAAKDNVASAAKDNVASAAKDNVASAAKDNVASVAKDNVASAAKDNVFSNVKDGVVNATGNTSNEAMEVESKDDSADEDIFVASTQELSNSVSPAEVCAEDSENDEDTVPNGDAREQSDAEGKKPVLKVRRISELMDTRRISETRDDEKEPKDVDVSRDMFAEESFSLRKDTEIGEENEACPSLLANVPTPSESSLPLLKDSQETLPPSKEQDASDARENGVASPLPSPEIVISSDGECGLDSPPQTKQDSSSDEECRAKKKEDEKCRVGFKKERNVSSDEEHRIASPGPSNDQASSEEKTALPVSKKNQDISSDEERRLSSSEHQKKEDQCKLDLEERDRSPVEESISASLRSRNRADDSSDSSSVNEDEVLAKRDLLDSSSDEWGARSKKGKKRKKRRRRKEDEKSSKKEEKEVSAKRPTKTDKCEKKGRRPWDGSDSFSSFSSSSESDEEVCRGTKRSSPSGDKPAKKRKPCIDDIDMKNDVKLETDCYVSVKKMSEEDLEEYLSALQEHYLEEDDSRDDRAIDRLANLSTLRSKRRDNDNNDDEEEDDDDDSRDKTSDKRKKESKPRKKEKGLMEFLNDDETGEQNSGNLDDSFGRDEEKSPKESGINMWNSMNKEFLLQDSEDSDNNPDESDSERDVIQRKAKRKIKKENEDSEAEENVVNEETVNDDAVKEEVKEEKDIKNEKEEGSGKEEAKGSSSDEKSKKSKKKWRQNRLLVGKLSDTDSDAAEAASQRKEEKRAEENSEEDEERKTRAKKARRTVLKSDSDSDIVSIDKSSSDETFAKKRKKKVSKGTASDDSSVEEKKEKKKPKRKRIKVQNSSSSSDDQQNEKTDTPNKGRKKIRKVFKDDDLLQETKEAAKVEEERRKRIAERQKMYDEMYEALQTSAVAGQTVDKLVLDFDEKTKEPLVEVHPKIVEKLKPHQVKGIKFMWDACYESIEQINKTKGSGCILAHCMGLGKTFQVVALCHTLLRNPACKTERVLVVSPLSTVLNWCNEFDKWLKGINDDDGEIEVYNLTKQKKNYERQYQLKNWMGTGGVMVLGYDIYRILSNPSGKRVRAAITKTFQEALVDPGPDLVICDEGHLLKNEATALAKAMSRIKTMRRIVLTGTPLQNNLKEYHCMVQFVKPNLLGTRKEFLNRFVNPITNGQFEDSTEHDVRVMKKRAHVLHKMLEGSVQRYDYSVLTPFLPPKQEYVISVRVSELQEKLYNYYLENYARSSYYNPDEGGGRGRGVALFKDYQNLQRVWTHPLVLKWSMEKQEKEREKRMETDSEGSLRDFIADDDSSADTTPESSSSSSEDDDDIVCLDDDDKDKKKKKKKEKETKKAGRRTRSSKKEESEEEVIEEAPAKEHWWRQFVTEYHLEDLRESPKLVLLFSILKECEQLGEKVLVFSQSLYSLDLIEHFLEKIDTVTQNNEDDEKLMNLRGSWAKSIDYFRLDGSTPTDIRAAWCKTFNKESNSRGRLFLISTRAGGLGINLVAANRVIIFDASWNPSHDLQSIFRVYRFGQKRPVFVYRFLAQGTMEEKIYERQVTKLSLAGRVVDEHQIDRHYNMADLQELYKFTPHSGPKETPKLPKDRMFADMLKEHGQHIVSYHEHDSLLENKQDEELNEEERKEAWEDYEKEKKGLANPFGGLTLGMPTQSDYLNAIKFNFPNMTEDEIKRQLPTVLSDLQRLNASNPVLAGQQMLALQQMFQRQPPRPPTLVPNYQAPRVNPTYNYQQQQLYAYEQQLRNAGYYAQRNVQNPPFTPTANNSFVPMYPTQDNFRQAYGSSFTGSVPFNRPSTSQVQNNRQPNTKIINIKTPSHK